jgi:hypothetical protein
MTTATAARITADEKKLRKRLKDLQRLKPFEAIESPAAAPVGSEVAGLVGVAAAARAAGAEMDQRVAGLRERLALLAGIELGL